jgi:hypothetical protein
MLAPAEIRNGDVSAIKLLFQSYDRRVEYKKCKIQDRYFLQPLRSMRLLEWLGRQPLTLTLIIPDEQFSPRPRHPPMGSTGNYDPARFAFARPKHFCQ